MFCDDFFYLMSNLLGIFFRQSAFFQRLVKNFFVRLVTFHEK